MTFYTDSVDDFCDVLRLSRLVTACHGYSVDSMGFARPGRARDSAFLAGGPSRHAKQT